MFPLYPEDGNFMFFRKVVTRAYLPNATASCATRVHNSELRNQCAIRYYAVLLPTNKVLLHLIFPLYPEDGNSMFFRNVVTRTYLPNDTASCATRVHNSACLSEIRIQCAIRYYDVLRPPRNNQVK